MKWLIKQKIRIWLGIEPGYDAKYYIDKEALQEHINRRVVQAFNEAFYVDRSNTTFDDDDSPIRALLDRHIKRVLRADHDDVVNAIVENRTRDLKSEKFLDRIITRIIAKQLK